MRLTRKMERFFKAAWSCCQSLDFAADKTNTSPATFRRWLSDERFYRYAGNFCLRLRRRNRMKLEMARSKAVAAFEKLLEHPERIRSEHHWRFIQDSAYREREERPTRAKGPAPRKAKEKPFDALLNAAPFRSDEAGRKILERIRKEDEARKETERPQS